MQIRKIIPFIIALSLFSCASELKTPEKKSPWDLTLFHTNDMHGAFLSAPATWREDKAEVGGMIALAWRLEKERETTTADLLLDAGDFMTGNPICDIVSNGVKGGLFIDMMNAVGYEVSVVGNHEFDNTLSNIHKLIDRAEFPIIAADIMGREGKCEFPKGPVILEKNGLKVGVMGLTCAGLSAVVSQSLLEGLTLKDQTQIVKEQIKELDPITDLIVLVTHNGVGEDRRLAKRLHNSGVDIIVGGHSHSRLKKPIQEGDILIVQAGAHLKNLGRLDLKVEDDRVVDFNGRLIELEAKDAKASKEITDLVNGCKAQVEEEYGKVVAELEVKWKRNRHGESNIGNWVTDKIRERTGADAAFLNSGTLRKNLNPGPVRRMDIHELSPFSNTLLLFQLTGKQVLVILKRNADSAATGKHGVLQVSGVRYQFYKQGKGAVVRDATINNEPIEEDRIYTICAPDYVVDKSDKYFNLPKPPAKETGLYLTQTILEAAIEAKTIRSEIDGRMKRIKN